MDRTKLHNSICSACRDFVRWHGGFMEKIWGGPLMRKGLADLMGALRGRALMVEVKTGAAVLTPEQRQVKAEWESAGGLYVEAHSVEELEDALILADVIQVRTLI